MQTYPGVYRAKCVRVDGDEITAQVPQVFGDTFISFSSVTGNLPRANDQGWVVFESAHATRPVWVSTYHLPTVIEASGGVILTSPNGTRYMVLVADDGTLSTTAV